MATIRAGTATVSASVEIATRPHRPPRQTAPIGSEPVSTLAFDEPGPTDADTARPTGPSRSG